MHERHGQAHAAGPDADTTVVVDEAAATAVFAGAGEGAEAGAGLLVARNRPHDPVGAQRVLAKLQARLLGEAPQHVPVSRYQVLGQIGAGGLGVVYAAYDCELDRRVALKFLHAATGDDRAHLRLVREAQAMARLSHPNVVTVYDVGESEGRVFIAMELVDGVPLSTWLKARRRGWSEVRDVMVQAARGLVAAHESGLVHRDFKPQNVLVGADGRIRVLDFGLARRADLVGDAATPHAAAAAIAGAGLAEPLTAAGTIMGTPAYMAPEQMEGGDVGAAADQFSFCVALFEALHRVRPFGGADLFLARRAIVEGRIHPVPASDVPAWLDRAVRRGLAPEPSQRYASMREVIAAITLERRTRRRYGLAIALAVSLLVGGGVAASLVLDAPSPDELARIETLATSAAEAGELGHFVYPPALDPTAPTVYRMVRALEQTEGAAASLARARATELRRHYADVLVGLGDALWDRDGGSVFAGDYYAAALVFDEANARAGERASVTRGELAELRAKANDDAFTEGEIVAAQSFVVLAEPDEHERAKKLEAIARGPKPPSATTLARLERIVTPKSERTAPRRADAKAPPAPSPSPVVAAVAKAEPVVPPVPPVAAAAVPRSTDTAELFARARTLLAEGRDAEAERAFHKVLQIDRGHAGALAALAHLYFDRGQHSETLRYATRAVAAAPRDARLRILLGDAHLKGLAYDEARAQYDSAAALGSKAAAGRIALLEKRLGK